MSDATFNPIQAAREYLASNLSRAVSLKELEEVSGLSRFHLSRRFKHEVGQSPMQFHMRLRIEDAMRRLKNGETPVDVAAGLGFSDDAHFSRVFKKLTGNTPGAAFVRKRDIKSD